MERALDGDQGHRELTDGDAFGAPGLWTRRFGKEDFSVRPNRRKWLSAPGLVLLLGFAVAPLFIMLYYSFQSDSGSGAFTLENYLRFFSKPFYMELTRRTIVNSLVVTVICLVIAFPLAYIMAKKFRRSSMVILAMLMLPFFTNQMVRVYSWLVFLQDGGILERLLNALGLAEGRLGILYTQTAVLIALVQVYFSYMVITLYMALDRLDDSLLEASANLGASKVSTFFKVILPLSWPGMLSGCLLVFVPCLGSFVEPRILGGVNGTVIGTVIEDQFFEIYGWNFGAAIAFVLLVMVMITTTLVSRIGEGAETT